MKCVTIDQLRLYNRIAIDPRLFQGLKLTLRDDPHESPIVHNMVYELEAIAMGMENQPRTIQYPTTWWDAFKDRWFPKWLRRWCPVSITEVKINSRYILTEFPWKVPERVGSVRVAFETEIKDRLDW